MRVQANGIAIEVEDTGADGWQAGRPVVLLIMGLGMQLVAWPAAFVQALVDAGFRVVRFDNRDIGLSQHFDHLGVPSLLWEIFKHRIGAPVRAPYTLHDMAADATGVLDALGIARAHVVGVSMGGMVAQRVALASPHRILLAARRSSHPAGAMRQMAAIAADSRRADELPRIGARTLVLHGLDDPLVPVACGHDTARRIPRAGFVAIEGMGHDLPPGVVERLLKSLVPHMKAG